MSDRKLGTAQNWLDRYSRYHTEGMTIDLSEMEMIARAYIAQAAELTRMRAQIVAADKLADKGGALIRRWETQDWVSGHTREFIDAMRAALSAYEETEK